MLSLCVSHFYCRFLLVVAAVQASTLLETANKLDILNLDEMAVQEELTAALEEQENEYDDEEVVHYNENETETHAQQDQDSPPDTPEAGPSPDECSIYNQKGAHIHDDMAPIVESTADISMVDYASGYETSSPDRKPKLAEPLFSPMKPTTVLDDSYSWEGVETMTARPVKLASLTEHNKDSASMNTNVKTAAPALSQFSITDDGDSARPQLLPAKVVSVNNTEGAAMGSTKPITKPSTGATVQTINNNNNTAPTGRKVKPLKPKPKSKELDFWGVNSKKALKFPDAASNPKDTSSKGTHSSSTSAGAKADNMNNGTGTAYSKTGESSVSDMFFGPVGLFGDDAYVSDFMDVDLEAAKNTPVATTITHIRTHSVTGSNDGTSTATNSSGGHQQARLPMGWFSGMLSNADGSDYSSQHPSHSHSAGTTQRAAPSFFDNLDSELPEEDPILKQVAYNQSNPHVQSDSSPINKVLDMWNTFMASEDPPSVAISGVESVLSNTATSTAKTPEIYSTGTGPAWVVTLLTWFKNVTGVTLIIQDAVQNLRYSGIIYTDTSSVFPNWAFLTVKLALPANNTWKPVLLFTLHILRLLCICIFSIVVRICICIYTLLRCCVVYISGTGIGTGVVSARLRRYFANENVNTILGAGAPAEEVCCTVCVTVFLYLSKYSAHIFFNIGTSCSLISRRRGSSGLGAPPGNWRRFYGSS